MHIVAIGWIYVVLMMAITEHSIVAGIMTFLMYGVIPLAIILYLTGSKQRRRNQSSKKNPVVKSNEDSANLPATHGDIVDEATVQGTEENRPDAKHDRHV